MRGSTLTLCVGLVGCTMDNPGFAPDTDSRGSDGTTVTAASSGVTTTAATSDATPTTSGPSSDADTAPGTSEPVTGTTSEPGTTQAGDASSSGGDSSTGPVEPPACLLPLVNDAFEPLVYKGGAPFLGCGPSLTLKGHVIVGAEIEFYNDPMCGDPNPATTWLLGTGYPPFIGQGPMGCHTATVSFKPGPACEIGQVWIAPLADINTPLVFAAFTALALPPFPIKPTPIQESYCGCPDGGDDPNICCAELQPGELSLIPGPNAGPVGQSTHAPVDVEGTTYEFYNLESWMGPECADAVSDGRRIDWIAVAAP